MNVRPLGVEGVKARIASIESRIAELEGAPFAETLAAPTGALTLPASGVGAGYSDFLPLPRGGAGTSPVGPMTPGVLTPANAHTSIPQLQSFADGAADEFSLDRNLLRSLIKWESSWNPNSVSSKGAKGLAQLMPETARELGVTDPFDPIQNLRAGAKYLRAQLDRFGSVELALAAYNAGPAAIKKYGGIPPFAETQTYVKRILGELHR